MRREPSNALLAREAPAEIRRTAISFNFRPTRDAQKTPGELVDIHPHAIIVNDNNALIRLAQALGKNLYEC